MIEVCLTAAFFNNVLKKNYVVSLGPRTLVHGYRHPRSVFSNLSDTLHVTLQTRSSRFSACSTDKLGVAWERGYILYMLISCVYNYIL